MKNTQAHIDRDARKARGMKWCGQCAAEHPIADFYPDKSQHDGLDYLCRQHRKACALRYRKAHRQHEIDRVANYRSKSLPLPTQPTIAVKEIVAYEGFRYRIEAVNLPWVRLSNGSLLTVDRLSA